MKQRLHEYLIKLIYEHLKTWIYEYINIYFGSDVKAMKPALDATNRRNAWNTASNSITGIVTGSSVKNA